MSESEIMYDDSEMTPQEQEKAVRDRVTELKDEIMETVAHLSYLHHEYQWRLCPLRPYPQGRAMPPAS